MMKKLMAAMAAVTISFAGAGGALAQKVAFYDHAEVVRESKAWKAVQAQMVTKRDEIAAQLKPMADEVSAEGQAIQQLISGKTDDQVKKQYGERIATWNQKRAQLQGAQQRVNQEFGIVSELAEAKINAVMADVFDDVAKSKRVDVVQRGSSLGYISDRYDVTADVLAAVDRQLATLSVESLLQEVQQRQAAAQQ